MNTKRLSNWAVLGGPAAALAVAGLSSTVRDQVGSTNVGIALAIVVVGGALVGRVAGLVTAIVAAVAFNFFHTQPYHSLRIHEANDVVIVALLLALGFVVSDISAWRHRRDRMNRVHELALDTAAGVAGQLAVARPIDQVWPQLVASMVDELNLADCRFSTSVVPGMPVIGRTNSPEQDSFVLPATGAMIAVVADQRTLGHLVITPQDTSHSLVISRRLAMAFADQLAIALAVPAHLAITR